MTEVCKQKRDFGPNNDDKVKVPICKNKSM